MISLFHFIGLAIDEQADYVWQGKFIDSRIEEHNQVLLYNLGEYYAEVFYDSNKNEIVKIKGFRSRSHLIPYINL